MADQTTFGDRPSTSRWRFSLVRPLGVTIYALLQVMAVSYFFDLPDGVRGKYSDSGRLLLQGAIIAVVVLALIVWPRRNEIMSGWLDDAARHKFPFWLVVNTASFVVVCIASLAISVLARVKPDEHAIWLWPYGMLLFVHAATLAALFAGPGFWRVALRDNAMSVALALFTGVFVLIFAELAKAGWKPLAWATLSTSHWLLSLYEDNVVLDVDKFELGVGSFSVLISPACSGYEGVGLVVAFLAIYVFVFRKQLVFPNAFVLFPIGIATIWLLNAVRIAVLVSAGAHFSPAMAVNGFHSQAGWIAFLLVTISIMALAPKVPYFWTAPAGPGSFAVEQKHDAGGQAGFTALQWLAPFIALMLSSIIISAFSPNEQWLYGLRVVAITVALYAFRDFYKTLIDRVSIVAVISGIVVGILWILTDPDPAANARLGPWLGGLPAGVAIGWLVLRAIGTIVVVPIAEELAFRGYLHRIIVGSGVLNLSPAALTAIAFVTTSLLFGLLHQRWLAAALAGAVYALLLYRSGRLSDPIAAHMLSNAVIIGWALPNEQWSLL